MHKIKSLPQTPPKSKQFHSTTTTKTHNNANIGLEPVAVVSQSQDNNKKQKNRSNPKKKRPRRRKIFLTVNDAFSEADFGREMREYPNNFVLYIPISKTGINGSFLPPKQVNI